MDDDKINSSIDPENNNPIENKNAPKGNFVIEILGSIIYISFLAYGTSSFIYMLHISNEEKRRIQEADPNDRGANRRDFSVLSGSYMYGPPYFPNTNTLDFSSRNAPNTKIYNPKDENSIKEYYKLLVGEQENSLKISENDDVVNLNKDITNLWSKNCKKKMDKRGTAYGATAALPNDKYLHDWLYHNSVFCNPRNLDTGSYTDYEEDTSTVIGVTKNLANKLGSSAFNFLLSLFGLDDKNEEGLNPAQVKYRKSPYYNSIKYFFFILVGTIAATRNIMNIILKKLSFDNNEFKYWEKDTNNKYARSKFVKDEIRNKNSMPAYRLQTLYTILFAFLGKTIISLIFIGSSGIAFASSIIFAIYKFNFYDMLKWWGPDKGVNLVWYVFASFIALLCFILCIYLIFVIPGFVGYLTTFIVPFLIAYTLFIYPFSDKTPVFVKNNKARTFVDKYAVNSFNLPIVSNDSVFLEKTNKNGVKTTDKDQIVFKKSISQIAYEKSTGKELPNVISTTSDKGNNKFSKDTPDFKDLKSDEKEMYRIRNDTVYEKYSYQVHGFKFINRLVYRFFPIWFTLFLHSLFKILDRDNILTEIFGQNVTISGNPNDDYSINFGTISFLTMCFYKIVGAMF